MRFLFEFIGDPEMKLESLFIKSQHGNLFHERADGKGPTISLFKLENGDIVGGFTTA